MATALATQETAATRDVPEIVKFRAQLEQRAGELKMALPSHISQEKFQRTLITACQQNPDLLLCDRQSLILAAMKAAQDALLPDGREAVIYPFNTRVKVNGQWVSKKIAQYVPMVFGLRKKILQSGEVTDLHAAVVYRQEVEAKHFLYEEGTERMLRHKPLWLTDPAFRPEDKDIVAAYSVATMKDGSRTYYVMPRYELDEVRECSQTGALFDRKGEPRQPSGPWVDWYAEQCKKSAVRRHSKMLPQSGDILIEANDESSQLLAGISASTLLDSAPGGEPAAIEDHSTNDDLPPHDETTGELIEGNATDEPAADDQPPAKEEKPARAKATAAKDPAPESEPVEEGDEDEEGGEHPAAAKAAEIMAAYDKAETIIDLKGLESKHQDDLGAMPADIREGVEASYDANTQRLQKRNEAARAREDREAEAE